ncbi:alpha/beta fold hydrolase [Stackebrandtia nassauensis]|uniref:Alpha/beta hydrolase n=1 Tax=Stackebrandtia nassauensis (strain DSM 44728 / CIP 108903 / NRRL B-16338 / NBRC 102104 / LLR-40K-21) TaxID=446470 RepID=D3Q6B0_STANL|nr:alpha/beta fold hydrolase [Stackebrandtia nassauensis]ADD42285.1 alpha/beta hydrolase [Stackebrandtia nassauensis DSM 44728]
MADYEQHYIDGDRYRLGVHRYPSAAERAVIMLPAMGVPAGYYRRFALQLREFDCDVSIVDLRGTGSSTPKPARRVNFGYGDLVNDISAFYERLAPDVDGRPVLLLGHSLGGQLGLLHQALRGSAGIDVRAAALIASGLPYHALYGRRSIPLYAIASGMSAASAILGHWPGYGFAGRQPRRLIRDWAHTVRTGRFPDLDGRDTEAALAELKLPVLAITVQGDPLTPPVTSRHLTGKLAAAELETHHYRHDEAGARLDHFTWARNSEPLTRRLRDFLDRA